jgi:hypothetical protein
MIVKICGWIDDLEKLEDFKFFETSNLKIKKGDNCFVIDEEFEFKKEALAELEGIAVKYNKSNYKLNQLKQMLSEIKNKNSLTIRGNTIWIERYE